MRYLGCHVSAAGGLENAIKNGQRLGVNTIQLHPFPPQRWVSRDFPDEVVDSFNQARRNSSVKKVFFHGIYLINLATPNKQNFHLSKISLVYYLNLCAKINGDGVIFHMGSFKDISENEGFKQIIFGINWILEHAENKAKLILESSAGAGNIVGDRLEELARVYDGVKNKDRIAFALDTQHMWASGYDWINRLHKVVADVDQTLELEKILAIHLNDSKTELGSKKDRHANLGMGLIGEKGIKNVLNCPKLKHLPFILETPVLKDSKTAKSDVEKLKEWAEE